MSAPKDKSEYHKVKTSLSNRVKPHLKQTTQTANKIIKKEILHYTYLTSQKSHFTEVPPHNIYLHERNEHIYKHSYEMFIIKNGNSTIFIINIAPVFNTMLLSNESNSSYSFT